MNIAQPYSQQQNTVAGGFYSQNSSNSASNSNLGLGLTNNGLPNILSSSNSTTSLKTAPSEQHLMSDQAGQAMNPNQNAAPSQVQVVPGNSNNSGAQNQQQQAYGSTAANSSAATSSSSSSSANANNSSNNNASTRRGGVH